MLRLQSVAFDVRAGGVAEADVEQFERDWPQPLPGEDTSLP
jgi:hypothetical protein